MGAGILDLKIEAGVTGQGGEALAQQLEEGLVEHFLVLSLHDGVSQSQRGARGAKHHADEDGHETDGEHELEQRETAFPGIGRDDFHD